MKATKDRIRLETDKRVWWRTRTIKVCRDEFPRLEGMMHEVVTHVVSLVNVDSAREAPSLETLNKSMPVVRAWICDVIDGHFENPSHTTKYEEIDVRDVTMILHAGAIVFEVWHAVKRDDEKIHIHEYKVDLRGQNLFGFMMVEKLMLQGMSRLDAMEQTTNPNVPLNQET